ncbi:MAG: hypothetical protein M0000_13665 [Actinomycetota bacterium]|nr:hypothetical protein [Actinomycetota bacterium]
MKRQVTAWLVADVGVPLFRIDDPAVLLEPRRAPGVSRLEAGSVIRPGYDGREGARQIMAFADPVSALDYNGWPTQLFRVRGGYVWRGEVGYAFRELRVLSEEPVHFCFGPYGAAALEFLRRLNRLSREQVIRFGAAAGALGAGNEDAKSRLDADHEKLAETLGVLPALSNIQHAARVIAGRNATGYDVLAFQAAETAAALLATDILVNGPRRQNTDATVSATRGLLIRGAGFDFSFAGPAGSESDYRRRGVEY